jgi:disulfide bond formation protein DsbB
MTTLQRNLLLIAWIQAIVAMVISLYFSNILGYAPCVLCWYQRIVLYPLVLIIPLGIIIKDSKVFAYVLGLSIIGYFISIYHNLLYYGIIPEPITPCSFGISCTTKFFELFGFISIPFLSFLAFSVITFSMLFYYLFGKKKGELI